MMRITLGTLLLLAASAIPAFADGIPASPTVTVVVTLNNITATLMLSGTFVVSAEGANDGETFDTILSTTDFTESPGTTTFTVVDLFPAGTFNFTLSTSITDQYGNPVFLCPFSTPLSGPMACPPDDAQNSLITTRKDAALNDQQRTHDPTVIGEETIIQTVSTTPEPGTAGIMLIGVGLLGLMTVTRKRNSRRRVAGPLPRV